jgi:hypothetical protein
MKNAINWYVGIWTYGHQSKVIGYFILPLILNSMPFLFFINFKTSSLSFFYLFFVEYYNFIQIFYRFW